jgi:hypothetical protein
MKVEFHTKDKFLFETELPCVLDSMVIAWDGHRYINHVKPEFIFPFGRFPCLSHVKVTLTLLDQED